MWIKNNYDEDQNNLALLLLMVDIATRTREFSNYACVCLQGHSHGHNDIVFWPSRRDQGDDAECKTHKTWWFEFAAFGWSKFTWQMKKMGSLLSDSGFYDFKTRRFHQVRTYPQSRRLSKVIDYYDFCNKSVSKIYDLLEISREVSLRDIFKVYNINDIDSPDLLDWVNKSLPKKYQFKKDLTVIKRVPSPTRCEFTSVIELDSIEQSDKQTLSQNLVSRNLRKPFQNV